jgi:hypothetical protein
VLALHAKSVSGHKRFHRSDSNFWLLVKVDRDVCMMASSRSRGACIKEREQIGAETRETRFSPLEVAVIIKRCSDFCITPIMIFLYYVTWNLYYNR